MGGSLEKVQIFDESLNSRDKKADELISEAEALIPSEEEIHLEALRILLVKGKVVNRVKGKVGEFLGNVGRFQSITFSADIMLDDERARVVLSQPICRDPSKKDIFFSIETVDGEVYQNYLVHQRNRQSFAIVAENPENALSIRLREESIVIEVLEILQAQLYQGAPAPEKPTQGGIGV